MADKTMEELEQELQVAQEETYKKEQELNAVAAERDTYLEENQTLKDNQDKTNVPDPSIMIEQKRLQEEVKETQRKFAEARATADSLSKELATNKIDLAKEKIRAEFPDVLPEWLTATDEAGMRTQATKFAEHIRSKNPIPPESAPIKKEPMENKEVNVTPAGSAMAGIGGPGLAPSAGMEEAQEARKELDAAIQTANLNANEENLSKVAKWRLKLNLLTGRRVPITRE